jgi:hypothetical protein
MKLSSDSLQQLSSLGVISELVVRLGQKHLRLCAWSYVHDPMFRHSPNVPCHCSMSPELFLMKFWLMLFISFKASSQHLRTEFVDTNLSLNPILHLRKRSKLRLPFDPCNTMLFSEPSKWLYFAHVSLRESLFTRCFTKSQQHFLLLLCFLTFSYSKTYSHISNFSLTI